MTEGSSSPEILTPVNTQKRFDSLMEINRSLYFRKPEVLGEENLAKIPANLPLVIATTHFSDVDLQTAAGVLSSRLKEARPDHSLGISVQTENLADPKTAFFINLVGRKHFFGFDVRFNKNTNLLQFLFNPENFRKMAEALRSGTDIITAAHEPLSNILGSAWELPKRSGLGAAYLAQLANATVLPVAVDIQTDQAVGMAADIKGTLKRLVKGRRPHVKVVIGEPFSLDKISEEDLQMFGNYAAGKVGDRQQTGEVTPDGEMRSRAVLKKLREQSNMIMQKVADLLPQEKRGRWKEK